MNNPDFRMRNKIGTPRSGTPFATPAQPRNSPRAWPTICFAPARPGAWHSVCLRRRTPGEMRILDGQMADILFFLHTHFTRGGTRSSEHKQDMCQRPSALRLH